MTSNTEVDTASEISDMDAVEDVAPPAPAAQECPLSMPPLSLSPSPPPSLRQSPSIPTACPPSSSSSDLATGWDVSSEASGFHQDNPSSSSMVGNLHNLNIKSPLSLPDSPLSESSLTHDLSSAVIAGAEGATGEICPSGDSFDTLRRELDGDSNSRNSSQNSEGAADQSEMDSLARVGVVTSATLATSVTDQNSSEEELECIIRENNHHENRKRSQVVSGGPGAGGGAQEEEEEEEEEEGEGRGGGGSGGREGCVEEEEEEEEEEEGEESMVSGSGTHHVHHPHNQSQHLHNSQHHHHHHHHHHPLHHHHHSPHQRQPHNTHHSQSHCIKNTNHNNNKSSWSCRRCLEDPASPAISATTTSPPPPPSHSGSILMSNTALCNNNNNNIMHNNNNINNNNNNNNSSNNIIAGGAPDIPVNCHTIANNENANSTCCVLGNMADSAGSSDEEVKEFMLDPKPVIFSSGPPAGLPKVMRTTATNFLLPNPPSFSICAISPRKRHRLNSNSDSLDLENMTVIQRPCLDFEKMQKTLMCKHNSHNVSRAKIVKIKTVSGNGTSSKCLFDPAVCSFRSISTAYSPLPPVEEPSCAY